MKVNKNVNDANDNIDEAQVHQKKARKKYTCLIIIIILAILAGIGLVIILVT
jgi:t-SNARE complex subunit (syntaxin)